MVEIKDYDADSYELEFEEDTLEAERKFYVQKYPNVNMVADRRLHCTTCDTHIGCAVANELTIRMHPVLRVTHCKKCHTFYNSGEFSKGEDGSELYCRWCGQGGEVYCCSKCPYVFCKKCILQNLSKSVITEIENNDDWQCFSCSPKVMWPLRAQHWALVNYIEKTKKKVLSEEKDDEQIYELMNKDPTLCCKEKKAIRTRKSTKSKRRRRHSSTSDSDCSIPEPKRIPDHSAVLPKMIAQPQQKTSKQLDELVCTPDILSMFSDAAEEPAAPAPTKSSPRVPPSRTSLSVSQKSATSQPPPLVIRQLPTQLPTQSPSPVQTVRFPNRQFSAVPRVAVPPPAYYTVNGFRVDLNAASQQETYRLPNGKLIQVKKQTAPNQLPGPMNRNSPLQSRSNVNPNPYSIRFNIQQTVPPAPVQIQSVQTHVQPQPAHSASAAQTLHQQHLQQQQQILNGISNVATAPVLPVVQSTQLANRYPSTPLGHAQTELEKEIHGAQEICQQIVGKCNTLMKSNAYKTVRNFNDVKDLHLHLSYLFTYTIDKFTTLQTKCADAMKSLTNAHDAANKLADKKNKYTNVDDDLEVVEPTTVCIEIDSDDDAEPKRAPAPASVEKTKNKQPRKTTHQPKTTTPLLDGPIEIVDNIDNDELELPLPPVLESDDSEANDREKSKDTSSDSAKDVSNDSESYDRENDEKLKCTPIVALEKDKEIERKLQEILDREKTENGAASPVNIECDVQINDAAIAIDSSIEENDSETNAVQRAHDKGDKNDIEMANNRDDEVEKASNEDDDIEMANNGNAEVEMASNEDDIVEKANVGDDDIEKANNVDDIVEKADAEDDDIVEKADAEDDDIVEKADAEDYDIAKTNNDLQNEGDKTNDELSVGNDDHSTKGDDSEKIEENHKPEDEDKMETNEKQDDCPKDCVENEDKADDLTNGQTNDEDVAMADCQLNTADLSCPGSPALTDNLDNDLLDEMDHQNNLTDNSFENISSPDMFDDMSKNGFDKATDHIVTLSSENADPDLV
ncbi:uncharacterized protein LOC119078985 isoform X2 [Bradysia coprophila]|uniref:uncharacterized protein LOC119078985 isoform X2 n=1 Tax=Bradysia coprophila TaxID=38358 RepID=UPI00187D7ED6|nr:uncharacterized protein LOC119078985 isoform X2 [Bradysia coprophila]